MNADSQMEVIRVPNVLRAKAGIGNGPIDQAAIERAESALAELSSHFPDWMQLEMDRLEAARQEIRTSGQCAQTRDQLYSCSHDMKGLGTTYQFPLVTRLAASLCKMIEDLGEDANAPMNLVDAHIDAIRAVIRDNIKSLDHPVGQILVQELERRVNQIAA
jgi:hypothetical protein